MMRYMSVAALTIGIAACGGGGGDPGTSVTPLSNETPAPVNDDNQAVPVVYEGTTLIVRSVRYERSAGIDLCSPTAICENGVVAYAPGQVVVSFTNANAFSANALVNNLGLSVNTVGANSLVINVPVLYERQWVRALQQEGIFTTVDVNGLIQIG